MNNNIKFIILLLLSMAVYAAEDINIPILENWPLNREESVNRTFLKSTESAIERVRGSNLQFHNDGSVDETNNGTTYKYTYIILDKTDNMASLKLHSKIDNRTWYWVVWWNSSRIIVYGNPMIYVLDKPWIIKYLSNQTLKRTAWHSRSKLANKVIFPHVVLSQMPPSAATCRKNTFSLRFTFQCPRRSSRARSLTRHAALYFYVRLARHLLKCHMVKLLLYRLGKFY